MAIAITVPRLGWSMEEGTFLGWLKQDGDPVKPGEALFTLEGEKAAEEIEALDAGILRLPPDGPKPGDKVLVGQVLAHLVGVGEGAPVAAASIQGPAVREEAPALPSALVAAPAPLAASGERAISPRARRVAAELGVEWGGLEGSGRNGRIRERDVRAARRPEGRLVPHTNVRRTIAARMVAGVVQAAPVTLTTKVDATNLVGLREQLKAVALGAEEVVPGYTDLIVKLTAIALRRHPLLQAQWREDGLFVPNRIDVAFAVDAEDGLLVPVVRGADKLTLREVAALSRELSGRARAGRLTAGEMRDATFTVTNLGGLGIDAFTPIVHLPQCAVLGVGRIVREPAVIDEKIVPRDAMTLSLTFDHRVLDGAPAARFLDALRGCLESPAPWLIP